MSSTSSPYFHASSLKRRFIDALGSAVLEQRITTEEQQWLQRVTRHSESEVADSVRVDRLTLDSNRITPFELATALLLSHASGSQPQVYLYTLAHGIERFEHRIDLLAALQRYFADASATANFEYEKIDDDVFQGQMLEIVDYQVERVVRLTDALAQTPSLFTALVRSLQHQLSDTLPQLNIDAENQLLQVVERGSANNPDIVLTTQTLAQAAFEDGSGMTLSPGVERRFLAPDGQPLSIENAQLMAQTLSKAVSHVGDHYGVLLKAFWDERRMHQRTRRDFAVESFSASVRHALYRQLHQTELSKQARHVLQSLLRSAHGTLPADGDARLARMTMVGNDGRSYSLAGTFVVRLGAGSDATLLWFSPQHRLLPFDNLAALQTFVATPEGFDRLRPALALEDQRIVFAPDTWQLGLNTIETALFAERVDSIIAVQARNLAYGLSVVINSESFSAMVDDALDVRLLMDPRQLQFSARRWRVDAPVNFASVWENRASDDLIQVQALRSRSAPAPSWVEQTQLFEYGFNQLRQVDDGLRHYCAERLQHYLCVMNTTDVDPETVRVTWQASASVDALYSPVNAQAGAATVSVQPARVRADLVSLLIERVSGRWGGAVAADARIVQRLPSGSDDTVLHDLNVGLINHVLDSVAGDFIELYPRYVKQCKENVWRAGDEKWRPEAVALYLREDILRLDLAIKRRVNDIEVDQLNMAQDVLDRTVRGLRTELPGPMTEVFLVSVLDGKNRATPLSDMLAVWQPQAENGGVMLWNGVKGWCSFSSIKRMQDHLRSGLYGSHREQMLALTGAYDRVLLQKHLSESADSAVTIRLDRVDDHALIALQGRALDRQQQDLKQVTARALRCGMEADLFASMTEEVNRDAYLSRALDTLSLQIDSALMQALLPDWLLDASPEDQKLYADRLHRFDQQSRDQPDFLFDIPSLQSYSRERLLEQLTADFPDQFWNPDHIQVTLRHYVSGLPSAGQTPSGIPASTTVNRESLTEYALNRFVTLQDAALSVTATDQPRAVELLTPDYLRGLVDKLDVGGGYMTLLEKALSPKSHDYPLRRQYFFDQLPAMMSIRALEEKLQGNLSDLAYRFVLAVIMMPDGIAREPVGETPVIISPLQLVADAGMTPDDVPGVFLICARGASSGPVILHTVYNSDFSTKEYASLDALLEDIRSDDALQKLLLARLDPMTRRRYDQGGFVEPHLPFNVDGMGEVPFETPGPVTLALAEQKGNALEFMFGNALRVLLDIGRANTVTNAEASEASTRFLLTLGIEQAMSLLPGKLGALVGLWQSETLLQASAASAKGKRWGEALSEFSAAFGVLVIAREQAYDDLVGVEESPPEAIPSLEDETTTFSWSDPRLNPEQWVRLAALEVKDVALNELQHDELLSLYIGAGGTRFYASVKGKVYEVARTSNETRWTIIGADGAPGPMLELDTNQRWQLDLKLGLKGGGGVQTRMRSALIDIDVDDIIVVQATGMPEIRARYRDKALQIAEAQLHSKRYLENCLDNLHIHQRGKPLDPRVSKILTDFFGVATPDQRLLDNTERMIKLLYDGLMDASMSTYSSSRYVVGNNRSASDMTAGFVFKRDPQRRMFLTERFFNVLPYSLNAQARIEGFELAPHFQAATLIHEFSHLVADTHDIAYLETSAPYPDLLLEDNANNIRLKADLALLQTEGLSHLTEKANLFLLLDNGQWRDIIRDDGSAFDAVLRITGTRNLDAARDVFLSDAVKRSELLLSNADSVTLLVLLLGRHNYVVPTP
jgi:hypothetical protein